MTLSATASDGVAIAYDKLGVGPPVVLIHGFGASRVITWRNTGWYDWLTGIGRTVIALDCRGHGHSDRPHLCEAYHDRILLRDVLSVMDAAGINFADIMGYSMGGYLAIALMQEAPTRVRSAILGGVGENYFSFWGERNEIIAQALLAEDPATITDPTAKEFRSFCERAGNDLVALAACMRRETLSYTGKELGRASHKVLVVCGEEDAISGRGEPLARHFVHGRAITPPRRNHHSTVGDRLFKDAVRDFLGEDR